MKVLLSVLSVAALVAGCGGDAIKSKALATLEGSYDGRALANGGTITLSSGIVSELELLNVGQAPLQISSVSIVATPANAITLEANPETHEPLGQGPYTVIAQGEDGDGLHGLYGYLVLDPGAAASHPTAVITIKSNSVLNGQVQETVTYNVVLANGAPAIQVNPSSIDFTTVTVAAGQVQKTLTILNQGNQNLTIDGFTLSGHPNFSVVFPGLEPYKVNDETIQGITFDEPVVVAPQQQIVATVVFFATGPEPAKGELVLSTNDPLATSGTVVPIQANVGGPCISISPTKVDVGGKLVGRTVDFPVEITSCGDTALVITSLALTVDSSHEFTLVLDGIDGITGQDVGALNSTDVPVTLQPNAKARFLVRYVAEDVSPLDGTGLPIRDKAQIDIKTNAFIPETQVDVSGFGVLVECPTAVLLIEGVEDGGEVAPQTRLQLIGHESYAATGPIASYAWRVNGPIGSVSTFTPSDTVADPKFEVNVAGTYEFELTVKDENGEPSCAPARVTVYVIPTEAIHIELLWHTPGDDDETNEGAVAGSDLDLHFLHPLASSPDIDGDGQPDGWFDQFFDCYWNNEHPNWGSLSPSANDDPDLDRDDTDGGGPENVNLNAPENGACYRIGVHYWEDNDFGPAFATVRVYLFANLVFEVEGVQLSELDMWSVTSVCWPSSGDAPEVVKVCRGSFDACDAPSDCGGQSCDMRIAHHYCSPLLPHCP